MKTSSKHSQRAAVQAWGGTAIRKLVLSTALLAPVLGGGLAYAEVADTHPEWPGAGQLFVGTNYQPFDRADKAQIQRMVKAILHLEEIPTPDHAADALAVAICHAHHRSSRIAWAKASVG